MELVAPSVSVLLVQLLLLQLLLLLIALYLLPLLVSYGRRHPRRGLISLLSVLLGWVPFVWLIALIWAFQRSSDWAPGSEARPG